MAFNPIKKPLLKPIHITNRFNFAKEIIKMEETDVKRIIYSDESKFNLFYSDGKLSVWREPGTGLNSKNLSLNVKHGGGSVMVWACFSYFETGNLVIFEEILTAAGYVNILSSNLFDSASKMGLSNFIFQQDNDPKHKARITMDYLKEREVELLSWPAQSPDLNPIENLWAQIKKNISEKMPKNKNELKEIIIKEWSKITSEQCQKYALSIKKRALKVFKAKGGHINN